MKRALVTLLLVVGLVATAATGSAAQLAVAAGTLSTSSAAHPCPTTATATSTGASGTTYAGLTLTLASAACSGMTVAVAVVNGSTVVQGSATVSGSTATVAVPHTPGSGTTVVATIAGWSLPVQYTPPVAPPTGPITAGPNTWVQESWTVTGANQFCVTLTVGVITSTSNGGDVWGADLNIDQRPFNGATTGYQVTGSAYLQPAVGSVISIIGTGTKGKLKAGETLTFTICHPGTPAPAYDPTLAYTTATGPVTGSSAQACVQTTVSVSGTPLFFAGWRADVDMTAATALAATAPDTFSQVVPVEGGMAVQPLGGGVYRVTGTTSATWGVRDDSPRTVTLCAS